MPISGGPNPDRPAEAGAIATGPPPTVPGGCRPAAVEPAVAGQGHGSGAAATGGGVGAPGTAAGAALHRRHPALAGWTCSLLGHTALLATLALSGLGAGGATRRLPVPPERPPELALRPDRTHGARPVPLVPAAPPVLAPAESSAPAPLRPLPEEPSPTLPALLPSDPQPPAPLLQPWRSPRPGPPEGPGAGGAAARPAGGTACGAAPAAAPPAAAPPGAAGERAWVEAPRAHARNQPPHYPLAARRQRLQGVVVLRLEVGEDGQVRRCEVARSSGHGLLDEAALAAARTWRFEPARDATGAPVAALIEVPIRFRLVGQR
ncbi:MAG: hypothetical protein KatS3mg102_2006 [Planctomycetota bacterium]|nr:MAG: hypothetical protein KatS3mg102_2006 [Planctomycetota bacterium]